MDTTPLIPVEPDKTQGQISIKNEVDSFHQWLISEGNVTKSTAKSYSSMIRAVLNSGKSIDEFAPKLTQLSRNLTFCAWRRWKQYKQIFDFDVTVLAGNSYARRHLEIGYRKDEVKREPEIPEDVLEIVRMAPPWLSIHRLVDLRWSDTKRWLPPGLDYDGQPRTRPLLHINLPQRGHDSFWAVDLEFDEALCALRDTKANGSIDQSKSDYLLGAKYHWGAIKRALVSTVRKP